MNNIEHSISLISSDKESLLWCYLLTVEQGRPDVLVLAAGGVGPGQPGREPGQQLAGVGVPRRLLGVSPHHIALHSINLHPRLVAAPAGSWPPSSQSRIQSRWGSARCWGGCGRCRAARWGPPRPPRAATARTGTACTARSTAAPAYFLAKCFIIYIEASKIG